MTVSEQHKVSGFAENRESTMRPLYFVVVFWGKPFRDYLLEFCLPSLLAPGNLPMLGRGAHKFLFCTTDQDWELLSATTIFFVLKQHIEPCFIEIPPAPPGKSGCEHMGLGHKLAAQMAHRDRAYGVFLTPDLMVSDGTVAALRRHAMAGARVVLVAAIRFGEEPLFEQLKRVGVLGDGASRAQSGRPLAITGRQMAAACIQSFHSETQRYEWEASYFTHFPAACWWRVPGEDGIVLHSLSWAPFLCDYSAVQQHDTSALEHWTMDGNYVHKNFGDGGDIHVVTDSDEMMLVSWAPLADRPQRLVRNPLKQLPVIGELIKGCVLRATLLSGLFDRLKLRIFFAPVRWHAAELTPVWSETERKAQRILRRYAGDLDPASAIPLHVVSKALFVPGLFMARIWMNLAQLNQYRSRLAVRLLSALRGDGQAWRRIGRRIVIVCRGIVGMEVKNP